MAAAVGVGLLTLLAAETAFRLGSRGAAARAHVLWQSNLWRLWLAGSPSRPLYPPFPLFANRDVSDPARLARAAAAARLPPSRRWTVSDFLQGPAREAASKFSVTSNSLGFRGPERSAAKAPGVYRVICLGAYMTFGQGVGDDAAYPAQLEALLNRDARGARRYEVWNGGVQAATALMGLARLRGDLFRYRPDLVILEYGFVDAAIMDDDLMPIELRFPAHRLSGPWRGWLQALVRGPLGRLYVSHWLASAFWERYRGRSIQRWRDVMNLALAECRRRGVPVIVLDHPLRSYILHSYYQAMADSGPDVAYVSSGYALLMHKPSPSRFAAFDAQPSWLTDMRGFQGLFPAARPYFVDIFHPNAEGHRLIAQQLAPVVERLVRDKR